MNWLSWPRRTPISAFFGTTRIVTLVSFELRSIVSAADCYIYRFPTARGAVGQNIAIQLQSSSPFTSADWTSRVASWYKEVDAMSSSYIDSFPWVH